MNHTELSEVNPLHTATISERTVPAPNPKTRHSVWRDIIAKYETPAVWPGIRQVLNTLLPYAGLWFLMYWLSPISFWLAAPFAVLAGGFAIRLFIIFHDCGHGSFFPSRKANDVLGWITGVLTFTPYRYWTREHAVHHATSGDLDRRGRGDVWTLTVQEYLQASRWQRFAYRLTRNPFILFGIAPLFLFLIKQRFCGAEAGPRERRSVTLTNLGLLLIAAILSMAFGVKTYVALQLITLWVASGVGLWLFYVQHQFEDTHWARSSEWDYEEAALKGSSFYKLPRLLQWFSGNIGFHHIHHLSPRVPNYHLEKCHLSEPLFSAVKPVTLFPSLKALTFRLWDEQRQKLVGYAALRSHAFRRPRAAEL